MKRLALVILTGLQLGAQPITPHAQAPIDVTGNWVSVISEDWRWRMVTPAKGDFQSIPVTPVAQKIADAWDAAMDEAAGEQCRGYGLPGLMRLPTRLRISWADDQTLKVDADTGTQTRLLHFANTSASGQTSWQGDSQATWEMAGGTGGFPGLPPGASPPAGLALPPGGRGGPGQGNAALRRYGNLKVVTRNLRPGYLRKNGVPFSANATVREYWDLYQTPSGDWWLIVNLIVNDPLYLQTDWITSLNFKKEPDGSKWDPTPCSAK